MTALIAREAGYAAAPPLRRGVGRRGRPRWPGWLGHALLPGLALLLWAVSLPRVDLADLSGWGLLTAVPPTWYAAAASAVPYLSAALRGRCPTWVLCLYQAVLLAVLFVTTSVTYPTPRYPWTYKHVGVVEHMLATGGVDRSIDIYNNWPGFFAVAAAVCRLTGAAPLDLARWAEPFFAVLTSLAVVFAVRGLTRDRRMVWVTLLVFTIGNWVGQNYFAPQALALVLALLALGCLLRALPLRDESDRPVPRRVAGWLLGRRRPAELAAPGLIRTAWLAAATSLFAAVVVTHQLTPVALLAQVLLLALLIRVRHLWLLGLWLLIEAAWLVEAWPFVSPRWQLFSPDGVSTPAAIAPVGEQLPGAAVTAAAPAVLVAAVGLLAVAGFGYRWARGSTEVVAGALVVAPGLLVLAQSYGGEGTFRAYLYALPWLSYLIARLLVGGGRTPPDAARQWLLGAGAAALTGLALVAMLGSELRAVVPAPDVALSRWFETSTPAGSYTVQFGGADVPLLVTDDYPGHQRPARMLTESPGFEPERATTDELLRGARAQFARSGPGGYFVLTEEQYAAARLDGQADGAQLDALAAAVAASPEYRVVYRDGRDLVARYAGRSG